MNSEIDLSEVSVVLLTFNSLTFNYAILLQILDFLYRCLKLGAEIIVVDNNSTDGTVHFVDKYFSERKIREGVRIIRLEKNKGFAGGANSGIMEATKEYVFFIASDVLPEKECITRLLAAMKKDGNIAIAQPILVKNSREIDSAGHFIDFLLHSVDLKDFVKKYSIFRNRTLPIFYAKGACFMVRKSVFKEINGFDDEFFLVYEDVDLCWRARLAGYKVILVPLARSFHLGTTTMNVRSHQYVYYQERNRFMSFIKNMDSKYLVKLVWVYMLMFILQLAVLSFLRRRSALSLINALSYVILNLMHVIQKRRSVQSRRKVGFADFMNEGIIAPISLERLIKKFSKFR